MSPPPAASATCLIVSHDRLNITNAQYWFQTDGCYDVPINGVVNRTILHPGFEGNNNTGQFKKKVTLSHVLIK
jgi:hypothetical protein